MRTTLHISLLALALLSLTSCLTIFDKDILPPPYVPVIRETSASPSSLYLFDGPIDWSQVRGVYALKLSHGMTYDKEDLEAYFRLASDNERLYAEVLVWDDQIMATDVDPSAAWDCDSVELFIGRDRSHHKAFSSTDHMIRVNLRSDGSGQLGLDDRLVPGADVEYDIRRGGYIVRFSISFEELGWKALKPGDVIRAEYAVNDADGFSRETKLQWAGDDDLAYADASKWGDVTVVEVR